MPMKYPCTVGKFSVRNYHKAILCNICQNWTHLKCTHFTCEEYTALSNTNEDNWFCSVCLATLFPFHHFLDDTDFFFADFLLFFHSVTLCIQSGTNVKKLETVT